MKFKAGDKVRYTGYCETFSGKKGDYKPAEGVVVPSSRGSGITQLRLTNSVYKYHEGSVVGLFTSNLELIKKEEAKVTEAIKVGDKVQVDMDSPGSSFHAVEGVVEEINPGKNHGYVRITKSNSKVEAHSPAGKRTYLYGLTKVEDKPFTYKDIQKGDTIRRTKKYASGATEVREGVVEVETHDYWADANKKFILAYHPASESGDITYELLNRPEKPKHWLDTQPVGVVGLFGQNQYKKRLKKTAADLWEVTFLTSDRTHTLTSEECRDQWPSLNYENDDKVEWLR